jgi:hypothetical protein
MGSQVPADRCVEGFALGAGRRPFFCLGKAGFENLQTMEVQILTNGGESERINQLWLWMAKAPVTRRKLKQVQFSTDDRSTWFLANVYIHIY